MSRQLGPMVVVRPEERLLSDQTSQRSGSRFRTNRQTLIRLRAKPASPTIPLPNSHSAAGTGTGAVLKVAEKECVPV